MRPRRPIGHPRRVPTRDSFADRAPTIEIRPAVAADEPALRRIIAAAFQQYDSALPPAIFDPYLADLLAVDERLQNSEVLVAEHDGHAVGTVSLYRNGNELELGWPPGSSVFRALAVEPSRRSRGAGRALVTACVERAVAVGADIVGLHTAAFMTAAVRLYERCGFERAPAYDITATDVLRIDAGVEVPPVIAYRLTLPAR
jgi:predicted N-acetyltransferase YhbS